MKQTIKAFPPGPDKSIKRIYKSPSPLSLNKELRKKANDLGILKEIHFLKREGYCVLENVFSKNLVSQLRASILKLSNATKGDFKGLSASLLLGRDPIYEKIVTNKQLLTVVEFAVGKGALLSQLLGGIRPEGGGNFELHIDSAWTPAPLPKYPLFITACLPCENFTFEAGCTKVVPKSHYFRRQPSPKEVLKEENAVPIECPRGSLVFWLGSTWHGNYPRLIEGKRVVLHISFSRLMMRPVENYDHLNEKYLRNKPKELRIMLGREDFLGTTSKTSGGADRSKTVKTFNWSQS